MSAPLKLSRWDKEDSDDEEETEDQNEEGYSDDEPDFEVIEFEASEN